MTDKIVDIESRRSRTPGGELWLAQVDLRLGRIETVLERLERTLWMLVGTAGAVVAVEALQTLTGI